MRITEYWAFTSKRSALTRTWRRQAAVNGEASAPGGGVLRVILARGWRAKNPVSFRSDDCDGLPDLCIHIMSSLVPMLY
jgi:hypothetical protein